MDSAREQSKAWYPVIFVLAIVLDRLTKVLAVRKLASGGHVDLFGGIFRFLYVENRGAAFGILQGRQVLFYIITVIVCAAVVLVLARLPRDGRYLPLGVVLSFILAGAVGNFIDRAARGYVVDFIYFVPIDFPVFNVADIYVTCGCILFAVLVLAKYKDSDFDFLKRKKDEAQGQ